MFKLNQMVTFQAVCNMDNNISRAAKALGLTQPAVTASIREFEKELDVKLFVHGDNYLLLTEIGEVVLTKVNSILSNVTELQKLVNAYHTPQNIIRLGFSTSTSGFVVDILDGYRALAPQVEIQLYERSVLEMYEMLNCGLLDAAVIPYDSKTSVTNCQSFPLFTDYFSFICRKDHPLATQDIIFPTDFTGLDFIFFRRRNAKNEGVTNLFTRNHVMPRSVMWVDNISTVTEMVQTGNAVSLLFSSVIRSDDNLAAIPISNMKQRDFKLFILTDSQEKPEVKLFKNFILDFFSKRQA